MKKVNLLFMALLLAVVGVQAETVEKSITLSFANDAENGITWNANECTVSEGTLTFTNGNTKKPYWTFSPSIGILSISYTITARTAELTFELIDDNDKVAYYHWFGTDTGTKSDFVNIDNAAGADLSKIKQINIDPRTSDTDKYATFNNITLTAAVAGTSDLMELNIKDATALGGSSTCTDGVITFGGDNHYYNPYGWSYGSDQDWSGYQWMVVVPRVVYTSGNKVMYEFHDNTNWAFNSQLSYGQSSRATVIDIKNGKIYGNGPLYANREELTIAAGDCWDGSTYFYSLDYHKIRQFNFRTWNDGQATFEAAVFLTNTEPNYRNYTNLHYEANASNYMRAFTSEGCGTICLPYNWACCGADVYDVVGVDSKDSPSKLYLEKVIGLAKAGKAYVIQTNGCASNGDYKGVTFYRAGNEVVAYPSQDDALTGTYTNNTSVPTDSYILVGTQWKKVTSTYPKTVGANKAYLTLTDDLVVSTAPARAFVMNLDGGETTSIESVQGSRLTVNSDEIYDLSGRRVSQPTKGIYVKNGKKVVIK